MSRAPTRLLETSYGPVEVAETGSGDTVTLVLHGLGGCLDEARALASGVTGRLVLAHLPGHGRTPLGERPWGYPLLGALVAELLGTVGARRAVGVSLGAGALVAALEHAALDRVALLLPPAAADPDARSGAAPVSRLAALVRGQDVAGVVGLVLAEQPEALRADPRVREWAVRRARRLVGGGLADLVTALATEPLAVAGLRDTAAEVLVVAQRGDPVHPVEAAAALAGAVPGARLVVLGAGGVTWSERPRLRELLRAWSSPSALR